jgi:trk system potassium uptake protein TrkH
MNWTVAQRILGLLLMMFSVTMIPPLLISALFDDRSWLPFVESFAFILLAGLVVWFPVRGKRKDLRLRDGFLVVASFWTVLGTAGALPLFLADMPSMSFTDAVFESMSGLTTTGATVLTGLDTLPPSILYYRQQLQWLGGMGIIVLAVAVLPMLGVGGMQLYRAETPGPVKDTKLTPRITETAKALWYVYLSFTLFCMFGYILAGMPWFDALCHAFSTVAIGGFSTHDLSIGYFDSTARRSTSSPSFLCCWPESIFLCTSSRGRIFPFGITFRTRSSVRIFSSCWYCPRSLSFPWLPLERTTTLRNRSSTGCSRRFLLPRRPDSPPPTMQAGLALCQFC